VELADLVEERALRQLADDARPSGRYRIGMIRETTGS
jgi:hypothetical protein